MLIISIILFSLAALLGFYLLSFILQNKNTPKAITFTHGPLAAIGLVCLLIYALIEKPAPWISIGILLFAALGGFYLAFRDITGKRIPKWLALGHGTLAVIGFFFLLLFVLKS